MPPPEDIRKSCSEPGNQCARDYGSGEEVLSQVDAEIGIGPLETD